MVQFLMIFAQFYLSNMHFRLLPVAKKDQQIEFCFVTYTYILQNITLIKFAPFEIYKRYNVNFLDVFTHFKLENQHFQPLLVIKNDRKLYFCHLHETEIRIYPRFE